MIHKDMNRKRILFVCGVFFPETVVSARLQTDLAIALSRHYQVTVLRPRPTRPKGFSFPDYNYMELPFKVIEFDSYTCPESSLLGRFRESFSHGRWCARYIRGNHDEIDLIYNDSWHLFGVYQVAKAACQYGIPYITPVQDVYPESLTSKMPNVSFLKWLTMLLLRPIDYFVLSHAIKIQTNSEKMANYLSESRNLSRERFVVVRNWQDEKPFIENAQAKNDRKNSTFFTFMYLGNIGQLAGIETLLEAFSMINNESTRLVIAGSGPAKDNLQKIARHYSCHIEFWDVPAGKVPEMQAMADVLLLPVRKGFAKFSVPSKLVAYMLSAKPIIACVDADSDSAECIEKSGAGWVVKPEDPLSLSETMQSVCCESSDVLKAKGKRGFEFAIKEFSKDTNCRLLCKVFEQ